MWPMSTAAPDHPAATPHLCLDPSTVLELGQEHALYITLSLICRPSLPPPQGLIRCRPSYYESPYPSWMHYYGLLWSTGTRACVCVCVRARAHVAIRMVMVHALLIAKYHHPALLLSHCFASALHEFCTLQHYLVHSVTPPLPPLPS